MLSEIAGKDSVTQLIEAPIGHVHSGRCEGRVVEAVTTRQRPCLNTTFDGKEFTHRASKPRHSKRSDVEFTWTNRPKNETHPGVALHVNWHLKEAYAFASFP